MNLSHWVFALHFCWNLAHWENKGDPNLQDRGDLPDFSNKHRLLANLMDVTKTGMCQNDETEFSRQTMFNSGTPQETG